MSSAMAPHPSPLPKGEGEDRTKRQPFDLLVVGGSSGAGEVLKEILLTLPADFPIPMICVLHRHPTSGPELARWLGAGSSIQVEEAEEKTFARPGVALLAPADYHLLVERDLSVSLSDDPRVHFSRPSIEVLFDSATDACGHRVVGLLLSGANADGAEALRRMAEAGGAVLVQDPTTAREPSMPQAALKAFPKAVVGAPAELAGQLLAMVQR